MIIRSV